MQEESRDLPKPSKAKKGLAVFKLVAKWVALGLVIGIVLIAGGSILLNKWLNSGDGKKLVSQSIQGQIGGLVDLDTFHANLPRGFALKGLKIQLPKKNGVGAEEAPSIKVDSVKLSISMLSFCYGTFRVKEALIDGMHINASREDEVLWTAGLSRYREIAFKEPVVDKAAEKAAETPKEEFSTDTLAKIIGAIVVPLRIKIENVGIKNLTINFVDKVKGKEVLGFKLGPVQALVEFSAWMRTSKLKLSLSGSGENNQLAVYLKIQGVEKINVKPNFYSEIVVKDLQTITMSAFTKNLPENLNFLLNLEISKSYQVFDINKLQLAIGEVFSNDFKGSIELYEGKLEQINLKLSEMFQADLSKSSKYLAPFGVTTSGKVSLKKLEVDGALNLKSLESIGQAVLPKVNLDFKIDSLNATQEKIAITNMNSGLNLLVTPSPSGGVSVGQNLQLSVDKVTVFGGVKNSKKLAVLSDLAVKEGLEVHNASDKEKISVKFFDASLEIKKAVVSAKDNVALEVPVNAKINATTEDFLKKLKVVASIDLGKLLDGSLQLDCATECQKINLEVESKIPSIQNLVKFVTPALGDLASQLPVVENGKYHLQLDLDAKLPPGPLSTISKRALKAVGHIALDSRLENLSVAHKPTKASAKGISLFTNIKGEIEKQMFESTLKVESFEIDKLPKPLLKNEFKIKATAKNLSEVKIETLSAFLPSLGAKFESEASAEITEDKTPRNIKFSGRGSIAPSNMLEGVSDIKTTGTAVASIDLSTADLQILNVSGQLALNHFSAIIPQKASENASLPLVEVKDMDGVLPFKQRLDLKELQELSQKNSNAAEIAVDTKEQPKEQKLEDKLEKYLEKFKESKIISNNRMKAESYIEVRPNMNKPAPLKAEKISFKDLAITNLEVDAELSQNIISINQVVFGLLGGKIQSSIQIAFDTRLREVRLSGQATELDTRKLADSFPKLREKMKSFSLLGSSPYIDGTIRLIFDAPSGDIAGGLEVTRIGKEQLRAMLLYVDPEESNPTIATMKKALTVGEVRQVSVPIRNGQIGLALDVRLFSGPIPTPKLQGFPLAQLVRNFTGGKSKEEVEKN